MYRINPCDVIGAYAVTEIEPKRLIGSQCALGVLERCGYNTKPLASSFVFGFIRGFDGGKLLLMDKVMQQGYENGRLVAAAIFEEGEAWRQKK